MQSIRLSAPILAAICALHAQAQDAAPAPAGNDEVAAIMREFEGRGELADGSEPTPAAEAVKQFRTAEGVAVELVATEPDVAQPLFVTFDASGRMWVVQYRQYPFPAGIKIIRYDQHLRAVFDRVPPPPPNHFPGKDRVTVFEDTDGDGSYDSHRDVLTDLNIATSVAPSHDGFWVLNPPYLLHYPDADGDAMPDGDPAVHLSGFGLEDTHAVANSLTWGPDGWLYGANGSTTTGRVRTRDGRVTAFEGQCIWRYHPRREEFEIFAEGGGNTFSLEFDSAGRLFSGTNTGNTRGMYYPQGSYGEKNWGKHGPLTNPYAFGYFGHMRFEGDGDRFAQTFAIYEADSLPERYRGNIIAANALHNRVWASQLLRDGSTYRTEDMPPVLETDDRWFRPVDIKVGPDGKLYMADWYDSRLTHVDPRDNWHKASGRIYRLAGTENGVADRAGQGKWDDILPSPTAFDLTKLDGEQLVRLLGHPNKFFRMTAVRVLGQRGDRAVVPRLKELASSEDPRALPAAWTLNWMKAIDEPLSLRLLEHENAQVRRWAVRFIGDRYNVDGEAVDGAVTPAEAERLAAMAADEDDIQVRTQLASTAKRLPPEAAMPIIRGLLHREEDIDDPHQPLLVWWAVESVCSREPQLIVKTLQEDKSLWSTAMMRKTILPRLMQRFATPGTDEAWQVCSQLLEAAPDDESRRLLVEGLQESLAGRSIEMPEHLTAILSRHAAGGGSLVLRLKQKEPDAIAEAIRLVSDSNASAARRIEAIGALGEIEAREAVAALTRVISRTEPAAVHRVALQTLGRFAEPSIGETICRNLHSSLPEAGDVRHTAMRVLAGRSTWSRRLIDEVEAWRLRPEDVPGDVVSQMRLHDDEPLRQRLRKVWGDTRPTPEALRAEIDRVRQSLAAGAAGVVSGDAVAGQKLFAEKCGTCHTLFGAGGRTGPDLTGYERTNLEFLIPAVVDPSAAIREEFTNYQVLTDDDRVLTGLMEAQDVHTVTLRGADNQTVRIERSEIIELRASPQSLMPDGLLAPLSEQQLRDLFAYLTQ